MKPISVVRKQLHRKVDELSAEKARRLLELIMLLQSGRRIYSPAPKRVCS